jgi:hypothetical protein
MRAFSFLPLVAFAAATDAGADLLAPIAAKPAKPAKLPRKPRAAKPAAVAADTAPTAPVANDTATPPTSEPTPPAAEPADAPRVIGTARTAATVARNATNFGGTLSDRDHAYIAFYASLAGAVGATVTLADIANCGRGPAYGGSAKPHDAGVINRLRKAGLLTVESDGSSFAFTPAAASLKSFVSGVA